MASRRDELNAYTFAKRRMLAAFVQPSPAGSEENAPRPLRGVVPSIIVAVLIVAGFGAWGMIRPTAPKDWDKPGEKVIVASDSTTRYVVLKTDGKKQLHPVLNMASARLLLNDPDSVDVIKVAESVLDSGKIPHGVTIGIPYAPDRLPKPDEAEKDKTWAVCQRPGGDGRNIQKATFVLASERDRGLVAGRSQLKAGELLYVQTPDKKRWVVDKKGTAYELVPQSKQADDDQLLQLLTKQARRPQQVSAEWLATLHRGTAIDFPPVDGAGEPAALPAGTANGLAEKEQTVGTVLKADSGKGQQFYVVLRERIAPVSDFTAKLLLNAPQLVPVGQHGQVNQHSGADFTAGNRQFGEKDWPRENPEQVNADDTGRNTVCSVLDSVDKKARTTVSTWAGKSFPVTLATGSTSAYVTPGSGQLFREPTGKDVKGGNVYLVTDTGLRYALQKSGPGECVDTEKGSEPEQKGSMALLGYEGADPALVPAEWAEFLQKGPALSREAACEPQGA